MEVTQVYQLVNNASKEILGESAVLNEDLSNIVDIGSKLINGEKAIENFTRKLVDHIGRVIFVNRTYKGTAPSILMDGWEYGSIMEKVSAEMPEAVENDSWELQDGQTYNQDIFYQPKVSAKFYNSKVTLEVDQSFAEKQVKSAFSSPTQMNGFLSMLQNEVEKSLTVKTNALIQRTLNNMIGLTLLSSGTRVVNLLTMYNTTYAGDIATPLTRDKAITDPNFIRYAAYIIGLYPKRLEEISRLFNIGGAARFTPNNKLHMVFLDEFYAAAGVFLQSDTFNERYTKFPKAETIPFWQGSGTDYAFANTSAINITVKSDDEVAGKTVSASGILGIMFDRDALGVCCVDRRVKTHVNSKAEFYSNFHKFDAMYFNDGNENAIVFTIGEASSN